MKNAAAIKPLEWRRAKHHRERSNSRAPHSSSSSHDNKKHVDKGRKNNMRLISQSRFECVAEEQLGSGAAWSFQVAAFKWWQSIFPCVLSVCVCVCVSVFCFIPNGATKDETLKLLCQCSNDVEFCVLCFVEKKKHIHNPNAFNFFPIRLQSCNRQSSSSYNVAAVIVIYFIECWRRYHYFIKK